MMHIQKVSRSVGTHDGSFHADEVTACALLLLFDLIDESRIIRTRDSHVLCTCEYVCDVGGYYDPTQKLFDHHQIEYTGGLSSAGMILEYLRDEGYLKPKEYDFLNQVLVIGVDAHDNGKELQAVGVCTFSHVVSNFCPIAYDADIQTQNKAFLEALHFVSGHLKRLLERYKYVQSCRQIVAESMQNGKDCLFFDKGIPWIDPFFEMNGAGHPALFVIMPAGTHWKLRCIPPTNKERMKVRTPLPKEWAGLLNEDLQRASGIPGAIFCHKGRFTSVWETLEDARKALEFVLKREAK